MYISRSFAKRKNMKIFIKQYIETYPEFFLSCFFLYYCISVVVLTQNMLIYTSSQFDLFILLFLFKRFLYIFIHGFFYTGYTTYIIRVLFLYSLRVDFFIIFVLSVCLFIPGPKTCYLS